MPYTHDAAALQVQEKLRTINTLLTDYNNIYGIIEPTIENIAKSHERISSDGKINIYFQNKLKNLYTNAAMDAEKEEAILRKILNKITEIRMIRHERQIQAKAIGGSKDTLRRGVHMKILQTSAYTIPLWVSKIGEKPPPLCGAIQAEPNYIAKPGDIVAAFAKNAKAPENTESSYHWMLAEVFMFNHSTNKYEVDDVDTSQKARHTLSKRRVIPLPIMRANPETEPDAFFKEGSVVMAVYPQTTVFYKAIVHKIPTGIPDDYELCFEDSTYVDSGFSPPMKVAQRYVIIYREDKRK